MGRPKGSKNKTPVRTYRDENNNLVLASEPFVPSERFKQGEPPPPPCEDKGNIRALLQGLSITLKSPDKVTAQKVLEFQTFAKFVSFRRIKILKPCLLVGKFQRAVRVDRCQSLA